MAGIMMTATRNSGSVSVLFSAKDLLVKVNRRPMVVGRVRDLSEIVPRDKRVVVDDPYAGLAGHDREVAGSEREVLVFGS